VTSRDLRADRPTSLMSFAWRWRGLAIVGSWRDALNDGLEADPRAAPRVREWPWGPPRWSARFAEIRSIG
jgi:hypothetical protein